MFNFSQKKVKPAFMSGYKQMVLRKFFCEIYLAKKQTKEKASSFVLRLSFGFIRNVAIGTMKKTLWDDPFTITNLINKGSIHLELKLHKSVILLELIKTFHQVYNVTLLQ